MITLDGQKMGKSLGNAVSLDDFFTGDHELLEKAYSPLTIRFFMFQAHYRSPLDFSNEALQAAEKGLKKLMLAVKSIEKLEAGEKSTSSISQLRKDCYQSMNDDFNTPILISHLFEGVRIINSVKDKKESLTSQDIDLLRKTMKEFVIDILGLTDESAGEDEQIINGLMDTILSIRQQARTNKDWPTSDLIRDELNKLNIVVKDTKDGADWTVG